MRNITFICDSFFSNYYKERFHINFYKKKGIDIKILNVSKIIKPEYFYHFKKKIKTLKETIIDDNNLEKEILKLNKSGLVIACISKTTYSSKKIFYLLEKYKIRYSVILNTLPAVHSKRSNYEIIRDILQHPISAVGHIFRKFEIRRNKFNIKPNNIFFSGHILYSELKKEYPRVKLISIPHPDLDSVLINKRKKNLIMKKFCKPLFISSYYLHPDYRFNPKLFLNEPRVNKEKYHAPLRVFFKDVCSITNSDSINIAEDPKRLDKTNLFKIGSNYFGKTLELTKNSNFVITLYSTAVNFAIILNKPIMFITNDYFSPRAKRNISIMAKFFEKKPFNCSREKFDKDRYLFEKKINFKKYDEYIKNFILGKKTSKLSCEIILNYIKKV